MVVEDDAHSANADTFKHPLDGIDPAQYKPEAVTSEGPSDDDEEDDPNAFADEDYSGEVTQDLEIAKLARKKGKIHLDVRQVMEIAPPTEGGKTRRIVNEYPFISGFRPHKEMEDAFTSLRKPILAVAEPKMTTVEKNKWDLESLSISGHLDDRTAVISVVMLKEIPGTKEPMRTTIKKLDVFALPEKDRDALVKALQHLIDHCWDYVDGKYRNGIQLGVFAKAN